MKENIKFLITTLGFLILFLIVPPICMIWGEPMFWIKIESTLLILGIFLTIIIVALHKNENKN